MKIIITCNTLLVHGGWSSWSSWSHCSSTCNAAERSQVRTCTNPAPSYGGKGCQGDATLMEKCNNPRCKVDGGWSAWSDYSACTVSCGTGITYTTRVCDNPKAEHGGKECVGDSQFRTQCDMPPCKGRVVIFVLHSFCHFLSSVIFPVCSLYIFFIAYLHFSHLASLRYTFLVFSYTAPVTPTTL